MNQANRISDLIGQPVDVSCVDVPCDPIITAGRTKNGHVWMFRFRLSESREALRAVGNVAADSGTDFSWYDAALISKQIRDLCLSVED